MLSVLHKKIKVVVIVSFIFISTLLLFFSSDLLVEALGGNKNLWFWTLTILGLVTTSVLGYFDARHPSEYTEANKIAHTPHNVYGLYALIYFVMFFILFYLYLYLTK